MFVLKESPSSPTVTVLCLEKDLKVKAMLDTGCSPNNYMREEYFEANKANLSQYEIKESPREIYSFA